MADCGDGIGGGYESGLGRRILELRDKMLQEWMWISGFLGAIR